MESDARPSELVEAGGEVTVMEDTDEFRELGDKLRAEGGGLDRGSEDVDAEDAMSLEEDVCGDGDGDGDASPPMASMRPRPVTPSRIDATTSPTPSPTITSGSGLVRAMREGDCSEDEPLDDASFVDDVLLVARAMIRSNLRFKLANSFSCCASWSRKSMHTNSFWAMELSRSACLWFKRISAHRTWRQVLVHLLFGQGVNWGFRRIRFGYS
jgi:hypothetical protein